jgi:hypothetical protein
MPPVPPAILVELDLVDPENPFQGLDDIDIDSDGFKKKHTAHTLSRGNRRGPGALFMVLIIAASGLIFDALRMLFNASLLHTSLARTLPAILPDDNLLIRERNAVQDTFEAIFGPAVAKCFLVVDNVLGGIDIFDWIGDEWACGGSIALAVPLLSLALTFLLKFILGRDLLLILGVSVGAFKQGANVFVKLLITAGSKLLVVVALYSLQIMLVLSTSAVVRVFQSERSCSYIDSIAFRLARVIVIVTISLFVLLNFYNFAGGTPNVQKSKVATFVARIFGLIPGSIRIVLLTFGIWTSHTATAHAISFRAERFDDDPEDEDEKHLETLSTTGASRSLIWMAVPFTILLAKVAEATNSPPILITSGARLTLRQGFKLRAALFLLHVGQLALIVLILLYPSTLYQFAVLGSLGLGFILNLYDSIKRL